MVTKGMTLSSITYSSQWAMCSIRVSEMNIYIINLIYLVLLSSNHSASLSLGWEPLQVLYSSSSSVLLLSLMSLIVGSNTPS